jgi:hypothetical protein
MLRILFNEPKRKDSGKLLTAGNAIRAYLAVLHAQQSKVSQIQVQHQRFAIWSQSFLDALDELEQSQYCSEQYAKRIHDAFLEQMSPDALDDYRRFVYFYKNAFIRLFSILDKLGFFMNEYFELKTETLKSRFSYFTVLRRLHQLHLHKSLEQQLYDLKTNNKEPLDRLRNQRNMEIHSINAEMLDDLSNELSTFSSRIHVENVKGNIEDLNIGFDMVCTTLTLTFTYITDKAAKG